MKSLDKKKGKELEWYKVSTTCDGYGLVGCGSYIVDNELRCGGCGKVRYEIEKEVIMIKKNVEDALTQQRTELLEEIDNLLIELDKPSDTTIITIANIREKIKNLINKKDE